MDWLGTGLAGDVLGAVGSIAGSLFGGNDTSEAIKQNWLMFEEQKHYNTEVMQNKHQWEYNDLRAAGINPLLTSVSSSGTLSAPNSQPAPKADRAHSAAALGSAFAQIFSNSANAAAQLKNAEANANSAKANLINAETNQDRFNFDSGEAFNLQKDYFGLEKSKVEPVIAGLKLDNAIKAVELEFAPKLKEKQMTKLETEIAMCRLVGEAQAAHYYMTGNAALAGAAAQQSMAATAARLGVSQEQLNSKLGKKAQQEASKIWIDNWFKNREAGYLKELDENPLYRSMKYSKGFAESVPLLGNLFDLGRSFLK